ncbi:MAG: Ig domain-containing protein [Lachnospiraceae bacterium]|nr:Ig domain-containing protein [Lachnospiraceae bacterium]
MTPANATNKKVTWKSSDKSVATISATGVVKGIKIGKATITVTSMDGNKSAVCKVTVKPIPIKSVKLSKTKLNLAIGKKATLKATINPSNATNKAVTWKTSNKKIATVTSKGVVKGVKKGKATITVTTKDGKKTASCKVTVK